MRTLSAVPKGCVCGGGGGEESCGRQPPRHPHLVGLAHFGGGCPPLRDRVCVAASLCGARGGVLGPAVQEGYGDCAGEGGGGGRRSAMLHGWGSHPGGFGRWDCGSTDGGPPGTRRLPASDRNRSLVRVRSLETAGVAQSGGAGPALVPWRAVAWRLVTCGDLRRHFYAPRADCRRFRCTRRGLEAVLNGPACPRVQRARHQVLRLGSGPSPALRAFCRCRGGPWQGCIRMAENRRSPPPHPPLPQDQGDHRGKNGGKI